MPLNPYESPQAASPAPRIKVPLWAIVQSNHFNVGFVCGLGAFFVYLLALGILAEVPSTARLLMEFILWLDVSPITLALAHVPFLFCVLLLPAFFRWRRKVLLPLLDATAQIANNPADAGAYRQRGLLFLEETKQRRRAIEDFDRALALDPTAWRVWASRAKARTVRREAEKVIEDATAAIELAAAEDSLSSEEWSLYALRAEAYFQRGDYLAVIEDAGKALELFKARAPPKKHLLWFLDPRQLNTWGESQRALGKLYYLRAVALVESGGRDAAKADFKAAREIDPFGYLHPRTARRIIGWIVVLTCAGVLAAITAAIFIYLFGDMLIV